MLGFYIGRAELRCFVVSKEDNSACLFVISFEHTLGSIHSKSIPARLEKPTLPSSRDSSGCAGGGQGLAPTFRRSNLSDDKTSIPPEKGGFVFWSSVLMRANSKERADGFQ